MILQQTIKESIETYDISTKDLSSIDCSAYSPDNQNYVIPPETKLFKSVIHENKKITKITKENSNKINILDFFEFNNEK